MKKLYLYYLIFLLTTIICGCQEQPNTEIIINKMETEQNLYKDAEEYTPYLAQENGMRLFLEKTLLMFLMPRFVFQM